MSEVQSAVVPAPVSDPVAPAPASAQAPASAPAPVTPQPASPAPAPVAPATQPTASVPAPAAPAPTEQILQDAPQQPQKPVLEALKVPEGFNFPKERLANVVSIAKTHEEAQGLINFAAQERQRDMEMLSSQHNTWVQGLKADPEFGGAKWEESKALYNKGIDLLYGPEFKKSLIAGKLEAQPELFKAVVKQMRTMNPKPVVQGAPPEPPKTTVAPWDKIYAPGTTAPATPARPSW